MLKPPPIKARTKRRTDSFVVHHRRTLTVLLLVASVLAYRYIKPLASRHHIDGYIGDVGRLRAEYARFRLKPLPSTEQDFEQATECVGRGQYDRAVQLLQSAVKQAPLPLIFNDLGLLYEQMKDRDRAINAFRKALARDAGYYRAVVNLQRLTADTSSPVSSEIEPNDSIRFANVAAIDKPVEAEIHSAADQDYFRLTIPSAPRDRLEVSLINHSPTLLPELRFYDDDGVIQPGGVAPHNPGESITLIIAPPPDTIMYLSVSGDKSTTGDYTLSIRSLKSFDRYEPNDEIFSARPILVGDQIDANIMDTEDTDFYSFVSPRKGTISVLLQSHSATLVPALTAFAPDKRTLGFGPDPDRFGAVHHTMQVEDGLTYFIQVFAHGKTVGDYSLIIQ